MIGTNIMTAGTGRTSQVFHKQFDRKYHRGSKQNFSSYQYGHHYCHALKECTPKNLVYYKHCFHASVDGDGMSSINVELTISKGYFRVILKQYNTQCIKPIRFVKKVFP
jgi:hypothetical protein